MENPTVDVPGMAERIAGFDWASTPLGAIERWPQSLKTIVDLMLGSDVIMAAPWGPEGILLYNDAYARLIGPRGATALGRPVFEALPELREILGPHLAEARAGKTLRVIDQLYPFAHTTTLQDAWFDISYQPVRDEDGRIFAVLGFIVETTERVLARRRQEVTEAVLREREERLATELSGSRLLQQLSTRLIPEQSPEALYEQVLDTALELMRADAVSIQLLEKDGKRLRRVATRNLHPASTEYWTWVDASHASTCGQALSKNERVVLEDVETAPELVGTGDLEAFRASGTRAVQSSPLLTRTGRPIGMISTHWRAPRRFDESDFGLFDILARQVADLLDRSKNEAALRESEERQAFLLALGDAMRAEASADGKIEIAARCLGERLGGSRVLYGEWDWERKVAHIFNGWFADGAQPFPTVMQLGDYEGAVLNDLKAGRTVRTDNVGLLVKEPAYAAIAAVGVQALLSVPLIVNGALKMNLSIHQHEPRHWTDEEVILVQEVAERLWAEVVRARAEDALRESESKFRILFETMGQGFVECEIVRDETGKAVDYRFLAINPAFQRLTGLDVAGALGRTAREVFPNVEDWWIEAFDSVVRSGAQKRVENENADIGSWFEANIYPAEGERFIVLYEDITARKRAELVLRDSEERQTFLLQLSDVMRAEDRPDMIVAVASRLLGERLKASRIVYAEIDEEAGVARIRQGWTAEGAEVHSATLRLGDFGGPLLDSLRAGETVRYDNVGEPPFARPDLAALNAIGIKAGISVPLVVSGRFVVNLNVHQDEPRSWNDSDVELVEAVAERIWSAVERARAEAALRESEERFRQFADASAAGLWIRDAKTLTMEYVSRAIAGIYGAEPDTIVGNVERWAASIIPDDRQAALEHLEQARRGDSVVHDFRIQRGDDRSFRWIRSTDFPLYDSHGGVQRIGGIAEDVTEAKLAVEHQGVLLAELQHRVRNIMAIIRSIAARTGERATTVSEYAELIAGRIVALSRVQALLTRAANISVGIATIVHDEVSVQASHEGQYVLDGPDVALSPKAAEILTLAVHELATNALKYGALSVSSGRVTIRWSIFEKGGAPWLNFDWIEEGLPPRPQASAATPPRRGFGSELIEGRIPYELGGSGRVIIDSGGAKCHLEFPLTEGASVLETGAPQRAIVFGGALDMTGEPDLSGQRVLVVEDEFFLATDVARALRGAGAEVIGPCPTELAARDHLTQMKPDAAVLDINLGTGPSYKLAETLKDSGIPFVFVTGYDEAQIPREFERIERLEKPFQLRHVVGTVAKLVGKAAWSSGRIATKIACGAYAARVTSPLTLTVGGAADKLSSDLMSPRPRSPRNQAPSPCIHRNKALHSLRKGANKTPPFALRAVHGRGVTGPFTAL